jgi:hypothetical protein
VGTPNSRPKESGESCSNYADDVTVMSQEIFLYVHTLNEYFPSKAMKWQMDIIRSLDSLFISVI